jgi:hypothetical protein
VIILAALVVACVLLTIAIGGDAHLAKRNRQLADDLALADARIEDLENELRHHQRGRHPAGRGLRVVRGEG